MIPGSALLARGEKYLGYKSPEMPATIFLEYVRNGNRTDYESLRKLTQTGAITRDFCEIQRLAHVHAAFLNESRTRYRHMETRTANPGISPSFVEMLEIYPLSRPNLSRVCSLGAVDISGAHWGWNEGAKRSGFFISHSNKFVIPTEAYPNSCYAAPYRSARAVFVKEDRMRFANAKILDRNSGERSGGTCCAPTPQTKAPRVSSQSALYHNQTRGVTLRKFIFTLVALSLAAHAQDALLVVTKQSHALAIVDATTLQLLARVPIGEDPHEVIVGPDHNTAYVSNYGEGTLHTLAVVDLVKQKPNPPIDLSPLRGPHGLNLHGATLWFTAEGSKSLGTLNPATRQVTAILGTGQDKTHLVWVSRTGRKVVASNAGSATMSVFDQTEVKPVMVPGAPAAPPSYTVRGWRHTLIPVGEAAEGFAISPDERQLWVGNADGTLSIIDLTTEKLETTLAADVPGANRLQFTPDGRWVLITTHTGKDLVVLDAQSRKLVKRIPIEQRGASGIQIQPDGSRAFVACPRDHYVAVVDLHQLKLVGKIDAGREPDGLAWWSRPVTAARSLPGKE